ncbi:TonB family protein, partial [bacterium]|nr:TonB family protein [bacterium]
IKISFQYIGSILFLNVFYNNGYVEWNIVHINFKATIDLDAIISNITEFFLLLLHTTNINNEMNGNYSIVIQTKQKTAEIFIDGMYLGHSPLILEDLNKGNKYSIIIYKFLCAPKLIEIRMDKKENGRTLQYNLTKVIELQNINETFVKKFTTKPMILVKPFPKYPLTARTSGVQGSLKIICYINKLGKVEAVEYPTSNQATKIFNESVIDAARKCEFTPAYYKNIPLNYFAVQITYIFKLINNH